MKVLTKKHALNLLEILATVSITGVGFAIGGTIGAAVMAGIGINLSTNIIQSGGAKLKERWLTSNDGILNHDIQKALSHAFIKALTHLETEYFKLSEADALPKNEKESIKAFFKELKEEAQEAFPAFLEKAMKDQEIKEYLYGGQESATDKLWERINGTNLLCTYCDHFRDFFHNNLLNEVQLWFTEELKTDSKESNKAWRAFQRLLLEGIQADVKAVQASQDLIQRDLQTLEVLRNQLEQLKDTIDHRLPNEPFQGGLEKAISDMRVVLQDVAKTTQRTEEKVDAIAVDVKTLLDAKTEVKIPKIPDDIQKLFDEGWALRSMGKFEDARTVFQKSLELATNYDNDLAAARAKHRLAAIMYEWDKNFDAAKNLLKECLQAYRAVHSEKDIAAALQSFGMIETDAGNLDQADAYLSQALEIKKKREDKLDIAETLHAIGWVEDHRGHLKQALELYDQALKYFLGECEKGPAKTEQEASLGVANCYHHKAMIYERQGKIENAESNYLRALEWCRKSGYKPNIGKILFLLAELKFREAQYETGIPFLDEAFGIYYEIGDRAWQARCFDIQGRLNFILGQKDKATEIFKSALQLVEESGDYKEQNKYLSKLGHIYMEDGQFEKAKGYFERAKDLSLREELLEGYVAAVGSLAEIAHIEKNLDERNKLLSDCIETLEKLLPSTQSEPRRAYIIGQIGFAYEIMGNFQKALVYYQKSKAAFESISNTIGIAKCLGSIAHLKGLLGKRNEEFDLYRELQKFIDGSSYYDLIAEVNMNLGEIHMRIGNLDEAKILFGEAEFLCQRYNLHRLPHVKESIRRLQEQINLRKPPALNFKQLINELFELINWFPEAKDSIFRLWMWGRKEALLGNYRNTVGIKFMLCQNDVDTFLKISRHLQTYSDLCLQVASSEYPGSVIDLIPFPKNKEIFFECSLVTIKEVAGGNAWMMNKENFFEIFEKYYSSIVTRYILTSDTARSESTGNEGAIIAGWSLDLPDQAHQLILSSSPAELIDKKIFFLPYERHLANDKLLSDLRHSKELGLIPIYFGSLPNSESVEVLTSTTIGLPVLLPDDAEHQRKQIRKVKHSFSQMLSVTKESAQSSLNNFIFEIEELSDICVGKQSLKIQIYILDFPSVLKRELHIALVMTD
ncbi:Photosystem I assembly protein Ycf3 [uncultured archaeon]|nr:Photosystem I assembly protein Ycf3 [uncultured archaeon]